MQQAQVPGDWRRLARFNGFFEEGTIAERWLGEVQMANERPESGGVNVIEGSREYTTGDWELVT